MGKIWFTADWHLGHSNIIKFCGRPFRDIEHHDEMLIANWNERVGPKDEGYFLGDIAFKCDPKRLGSILRRLNGRKHLILGNHDRANTDGIWSSQPVPYREIKIDGVRVTLLHYGMRVWNHAHHGAYHFYGHSHDRLPGFRTPWGGGCCDVGVDSWDYKPVDFETLREHVAKLPLLHQEVGEHREEGEEGGEH